ncbi:hypothetical protein HDU98_010635 [Podochytrium sp. JEL0797]|nr:hypothetical protein HDU98_010635 [Podochytrium sp. JEL0797]
MSAISPPPPPTINFSSLAMLIVCSILFGLTVFSCLSCAGVGLKQVLQRVFASHKTARAKKRAAAAGTDSSASSTASPRPGTPTSMADTVSSTGTLVGLLDPHFHTENHSVSEKLRKKLLEMEEGKKRNTVVILVEDVSSGGEVIALAAVFGDGADAALNSAGTCVEVGVLPLGARGVVALEVEKTPDREIGDVVAAIPMVAVAEGTELEMERGGTNPVVEMREPVVDPSGTELVLVPPAGLMDGEAVVFAAVVGVSTKCEVVGMSAAGGGPVRVALVGTATAVMPVELKMEVLGESVDTAEALALKLTDSVVLVPKPVTVGLPSVEAVVVGEGPGRVALDGTAPAVVLELKVGGIELGVKRVAVVDVDVDSIELEVKEGFNALVETGSVWIDLVAEADVTTVESVVDPAPESVWVEVGVGAAIVPLALVEEEEDIDTEETVEKLHSMQWLAVGVTLEILVEENSLAEVEDAVTTAEKVVKVVPKSVWVEVGAALVEVNTSEVEVVAAGESVVVLVPESGCAELEVETALDALVEENSLAEVEDAVTTAESVVEVVPKSVWVEVGAALVEVNASEVEDAVTTAESVVEVVPESVWVEVGVESALDALVEVNASDVEVGMAADESVAEVVPESGCIELEVEAALDELVDANETAESEAEVTVTEYEAVELVLGVFGMIDDALETVSEVANNTVVVDVLAGAEEVEIAELVEETVSTCRPSGSGAVAVELEILPVKVDLERVVDLVFVHVNDELVEEDVEGQEGSWV